MWRGWFRRWTTLSLKERFGVLAGILSLIFAAFGPLPGWLSNDEKVERPRPADTQSRPTIDIPAPAVQAETVMQIAPAPTPTPTATPCPAIDHAAIQGAWVGTLICNGQNFGFDLDLRFDTGRSLQGRLVFNRLDDDNESKSRDLDLVLTGYFENDAREVLLAPGGYNLAIGYPAATLSLRTAAMSPMKLSGSVGERVSAVEVCGVWSAQRKQVHKPSPDFTPRGATRLTFRGGNSGSPAIDPTRC